MIPTLGRVWRMARRTTGALPVVSLAKPLRRSILRGHPWVYDRAVRLPRGVESGQVAVIRDDKGPLGVAFLDPRSPIRCRMLELGGTKAPDAGWVRKKSHAATYWRAQHPRLQEFDALRLIHGEGDGMPGLIFDWYAGHGVLKYDGRGSRAFWKSRIDWVLEGVRSAGIALDSVWCRDGVQLEGKTPKEVAIKEGPACFHVDVRHGHKTGFFLDQRDNRRFVGSLAGKRVLDLFCYAGGFGVHAMAAGARNVSFVDQAEPALATAKRNVETSSGAGTAEFIAKDVFEFLEKNGRSQYDVVVCDPPSFAPNEQAKKKALNAYKKLNTLAGQAVSPGGVLCTASCSSHVTHADFDDVLSQALPAEEWKYILRATADSDHPGRPGFPEGNYLTFRALAKI